MIYAPEIEKRTRKYLRSTNSSWQVDETYIKVNGEWKYLYRAVDSEGNTLDFMLSAKRDHKAAKRFLKKVLKGRHNQQPRVINVDKNPAYPPGIEELKVNKLMEELATMALAEYDLETRFKVRAIRGSTEKALEVLEKLKEDYQDE